MRMVRRPSRPMSAAPPLVLLLLMGLALPLPPVTTTSTNMTSTPAVDYNNWDQCARTCSEVALCSPLSPQPPDRFEVVAPLEGGPRDLDGYGANGSEWHLWLRRAVSQNKITTLASFNSLDGGFSAGPNAGLLCEAHRQGIRVVDWDTVCNLYADFDFVDHPERILNETAMHIWVEMAAHFMVEAGIDGFGLDIEGPIYTLLDANSSARESLTNMLVTLKARMEARVPGSLLAVWVQGGAPWNSAFSIAQLQAAFKAVDQFWSMDYSACGMPYTGMAEAPWRWTKNCAAAMDALGFPRGQVVHVFPWHGCDFNCGNASNSLGGVNCTGLERAVAVGPRSGYANPDLLPGERAVSTPGYAQLLPHISLGRAQGYTARYNATEGANSIDYYNTTTHEYHQIWYDDPASLKIKYDWAQHNRSARGVGMWVPSATKFNVAATEAMWAAVPKVGEGAGRTLVPLQ